MELELLIWLLTTVVVCDFWKGRFSPWYCIENSHDLHLYWFFFALSHMCHSTALSWLPHFLPHNMHATLLSFSWACDAVSWACTHTSKLPCLDAEYSFQASVEADAEKKIENVKRKEEIRAAIVLLGSDKEEEGGMTMKRKMHFFLAWLAPPLYLRKNSLQSSLIGITMTRIGHGRSVVSLITAFLMTVRSW